MSNHQQQAAKEWLEKARQVVVPRTYDPVEWRRVNRVAAALEQAERRVVERIELLAADLDARGQTNGAWTAWERAAYGDAADCIRAALAEVTTDPGQRAGYLRQIRSTLTDRQET